MNNASKKGPGIARKYMYFGIGAIIFLIFAYVPLSENFLISNEAILTPEGRLSLAILFFCVFLWVTEPIPFHITGIIGMIAMTFARIVDINTGRIATFDDIVRLGFGHNTIVFFIGVLTLSTVITKSGIGKRIAMFILTITGNKSSNVLLGFLIAGTVISFFITDMAVAAMLMPIAKSLCEEEKLVPLKSNFGRALLIGVAWSATIGGSGTPAAGGANIIAFDMIRNTLGYDLGFLEWMMYGVPAAMVMLIPGWLLLLLFFKPEMKYLSRTKEQFVEEFKALGPMSRNEKSTAVIFFVTVTLWIAGDFISPLIGINIGAALPAFLCTVLFFLPGVTDYKWKEISNDISWESVILIATGIAMGMTMFNSGAAAWMAETFLGGLFAMHPFMQITIAVFVVSLIKVILSSNTVTASIIMPVIIAMVVSRLDAGMYIPVMGLGLIFPVAISLSFCFILVTSAPTNVIPYSTGYFTMMDFAKPGIIMTVISSVLMAVVMLGIGSLTGLFG